MDTKTGSVIKILPEMVVSQIAAGEVVERPASVVKELMENAIDAGARRIEVEIKEGGQKLIEISDDGVGMSHQDAVLAFTQHATSKIQSVEDLNTIATLGFRGEALASIASVSRVTLVTRRQERDIGTRVNVEGGQIKLVEEAAHPCGTRLQIKNLFFNVPARRKFLKSQQAEMSAISDIVCHYILAYPELAFRFTRGNVPVTTSNGTGNLVDAVLAIYGPDVARHLLPLQESPNFSGAGISLRGYISLPNDPRSTSRHLTTLINRRYVRSKLLSMAISKALTDFFPKGKYPILVLDLRLPGDLLDINVHPQKAEVRFRDERGIFGLVYESIKTSLSGLKLARGAIEQATKETFSTPGLQPITQHFGTIPGTSGEDGFHGGAPHYGDTSSSHDENISGHSSPAATDFPPRAMDRIYHIRESTDPGCPTDAKVNAFEAVRTLNGPKILAQVLNCYLLGEDREGMFLVDQHAAHERVLFDTYQETYRDVRVNSQALLFPVPLKLLPSERLLLNEKGEELKELGFAIHQEDDGQFYVTSVPILGDQAKDHEAIQNMLSQVLGDWDARTMAETKVGLLKIMACRAAVKAGDPLMEPEMRSLLEQLLKTKNPFTCPHGRPTILRLSLKQIEHGFLRI